MTDQEVVRALCLGKASPQGCTTMTNTELLERAVAHHMNGQLSEAGQIYEQILADDPRAADAWNLSGVLAHQRGDAKVSVDRLNKAIRIRSDVPEYHVNLATALVDSGNHTGGLKAAGKCLRLDRGHKLAWNVQGNALLALDRVEEAIESFEKAIAIDDRFVEAWANLGRLHREAGSPEKAEEAIHKALSLNPNHAMALNNLGALLLDAGENDKAIEQLEAAMQLTPTSSIATNLGNAYQNVGRINDAEAAFQKAIELDNQSADAWYNAGVYFQSVADIENALDCFRIAYQLNSEHPSAINNYLFCLNLSTRISRVDVLQEHMVWGAGLVRRPLRNFRGQDTSPTRRLRIGYVSPDFRAHPLASFVQPMIEVHDREQVEIFCYSDCGSPDSVTATMSAASDQWRMIHGMTDEAVWGQVRKDQIDILVDLTGHTASDRLNVFANRAAPIQVSMLGYLNTTGVEQVDYIVSDMHRDPESEDAYYVEKVVRLPSGGCCWQPPKNAPEPNSLPMLERGYVTFGCTHRANKLTDATLQLWSGVMGAVPNSRLLVFHNSLAGSPELQARIGQRMSEFGIDASRIDMAWHDGGEYLPAYHAMDILLECVPWSSGTTALDALWMGVPIPTIYGAQPVGRPTASVMHRLDLEELIAFSDEDYIGLVAELAQQTELLQSLRGQLRQLMQSTICDATTFVSELETAYRDMWQDWCNA